MSKARLAGFFYLFTGGTAYAYAERGKMLVPGSVADTAATLVSHASTFRMALVADLIGVACYVVVVALLYQLFAHVSRGVSLSAALIGTVGCAVQVAACAFHAGVIVVMISSSDAPAFPNGQGAQLAYTLVRLQQECFSIAILFFGIYCGLIGWLTYRSTFMPRVVGVLMSVGGAMYIAAMVTQFLDLPAHHFLGMASTLFGGVGEGVFLLWLLAFGVDEGRWQALREAVQ